MLFVVPRLLGAGIPLWRQGHAQPLQLLRTHAWPDGMAFLHYQVAGTE
jgi:hypothetical protein